MRIRKVVHILIKVIQLMALIASNKINTKNQSADKINKSTHTTTYKVLVDNGVYLSIKENMTNITALFKENTKHFANNEEIIITCAKYFDKRFKTEGVLVRVKEFKMYNTTNDCLQNEGWKNIIPFVNNYDQALRYYKSNDENDPALVAVKFDFISTVENI